MTKIIIEKMVENIVFWPDKVAKELVKRFKVKKQVVTTGTSMSGDPHIGNLNDVVKGHAIFLALKRLKVPSELVWVSDDMDPFRSVPRDMPKDLENFLGIPVCNIPDFWGCHKSFAEHFEEKFIQQLEKLFIKPKIMKGIEMYEKGMYNKVMKIAMKKRGEIAKVLNKYRTSPLPENWYPIDVICEKCGKITNTKILSYDERKNVVEYECVEEPNLLKKKYEVVGCGYKGKTSILNGKAKLTWRVEWPARWVFLKTTCEPFGKEHAAAGGSWDTAKEIVKLLGWLQPYPVVYEHFLVKGQKMSKSLGNVITLEDMLKYMRPEHVRYWMIQGKLTIAKDINLKQIVPLIWNEFDKAEKIYFGIESSGNKKKDNNFRRAYELAMVKPLLHHFHIPFEVMVELVKILPEKHQLEFVIKKLKEFGRLKEENERIVREVELRLVYAKKWYEDFGKIKVEFEIGGKEKVAISELIKFLELERDGEEIQKKIFEIAGRFNINAAEFFKLLYKIILNSDKGPRLGPYIIEIGKEEVLKKLRGVLK